MKLSLAMFCVRRSRYDGLMHDFGEVQRSLENLRRRFLVAADLELKSRTQLHETRVTLGAALDEIDRLRRLTR